MSSAPTLPEPAADPAPSPWLVPFDGSFRVDNASTAPPGGKRDKKAEKEDERRLDELGEELDGLQRRLYAENSRALLLVFQAMDAAGKDGVIRAVMHGVDPAGCEVTAFKQPSSEELDHDFLWRAVRRLPERGRIGIFNRSYYEEVLVVRVHPEYLGGQRLPGPVDPARLWEERFESIRQLERHLARSGTAVVKFWLNVSAGEQKKRFLSRLDEPEKNWKFNEGDVAEAKHWDGYMAAYQAALSATSRPWAPWYAVPADDKDFARRVVAEVIAETLRRMKPEFPAVSEERRRILARMREQLG